MSYMVNKKNNNNNQNNNDTERGEDTGGCSASGWNLRRRRVKRHRDKFLSLNKLSLN